jgi:hypothetical protein
MGIFREKQAPPATYESQNYPAANGYGDDVPVTNGYGDEMQAHCPPHTTERKLLLRIDLHVMPFLCIMYRMGNKITFR